MKIKSLLDMRHVRQMTHKETEFLATMIMAESTCQTFPQEFQKELDLGPKEHGNPAFFHARLIYKRLQIGKIPISGWALLFLADLSDRPAVAVMYAHVIVELYRKHRVEINLDHIATAFPDGFPTEDALKDCWYAQKIPMDKRENMGLDNYLDVNEELWLVEEVEA